MLYINTHRWEQNTTESQNVSIKFKSTTAICCTSSSGLFGRQIILGKKKGPLFIYATLQRSAPKGERARDVRQH